MQLQIVIIVIASAICFMIVKAHILRLRSRIKEMDGRLKFIEQIVHKVKRERTDP
jgi:hypothetical protein